MRRVKRRRECAQCQNEPCVSDEMVCGVCRVCLEAGSLEYQRDVMLTQMRNEMCRDMEPLLCL